MSNEWVRRVLREYGERLDREAVGDTPRVIIEGDGSEEVRLLRALLDRIDAQEIDAEPVQRAYLQGAADALDDQSPGLRSGPCD